MINTVVTVKELCVQLDDKAVIDNFSIAVAPGEFCYLTGDTGSGKSTFLKVLYGDCSYQAGSVKVCDMEVKNIKRSKLYTLRRKMGIIFDDFQLFQHKTVLSNLEFVLQAIDITDIQTQKDLINKTLEQTGSESFINKMVFKLSAGEQQKVAISRALLNTPSLILADEPTGNLDPRSSEEVVALLQTLAVDNKIAILMSTHDMHVVEKCPARQERFGITTEL